MALRVSCLTGAGALGRGSWQGGTWEGEMVYLHLLPPSDSLPLLPIGQTLLEAGGQGSLLVHAGQPPSPEWRGSEWTATLRDLQKIQVQH